MTIIIHTILSAEKEKEKEWDCCRKNWHWISNKAKAGGGLIVKHEVINS